MWFFNLWVREESSSMLDAEGYILNEPQDLQRITTMEPGWFQGRTMIAMAD